MSRNLKQRLIFGLTLLLAMPASTSAAPRKFSEAEARRIAREAYFWAWPMVNLHTRRTTFDKLPEPGLLGGFLPAGPTNRLAMLTDYVTPEERAVACPNQDVVYGLAVLGLDKDAVVVQVPDFGERFWVYQVVDMRTDSFAKIGKMHGSKPGFYLLTGPNWKGKVPEGIQQVFQSSTGTGIAIPRVFQSDDPADKQAVQAVLKQIAIYPLSEFDGKMKSRDWAKLPHFPNPGSGDSETKWVDPNTFFDLLPAVLEQAPPLPGEEKRYAELQALLAAAKADPRLMDIMKQAAAVEDREKVQPLFHFSNYGIALRDNWRTIDNGAAFGSDYVTRTAVARSNIFVNAVQETKYFYLESDASGRKLNGQQNYTITFPKGGLPPVKGFWSLTLYNEHHFFAPNDLKRYSLGTKNKGLKYNQDGSLTLYVQTEPPSNDKRANWLPAPKAEFALYMRAYWPESAVVSNSWTPPPVLAAK